MIMVQLIRVILTQTPVHLTQTLEAVSYLEAWGKTFETAHFNGVSFPKTPAHKIKYFETGGNIWS